MVDVDKRARSPRTILISWSTGKDSAYALHKIRENNEYNVVGLFSTITEEYDRVSMHATRHALLKKQAEALNLPLYPIFIPAVCTIETYENRMQAFLESKMMREITHIVFGDLFLENVRRYRESTLATTHITPLFPLWGKNTTMLATEMIDAGIKAVVTCVDPKKLDASFAGRPFNEKFLSDLPADVDPCGEHGEFHTFVYDGPLFKNPIPIFVGEIVEREGFVFADCQ